MNKNNKLKIPKSLNDCENLIKILELCLKCDFCDELNNDIRDGINKLMHLIIGHKLQSMGKIKMPTIKKYLLDYQDLFSDCLYYVSETQRLLDEDE